MCALCLTFETESPEDDYFVSTECGHVYHHNCIKLSYETGYKECPVDRLPIDFGKLRRLYGSELRGKRSMVSTGSEPTSASLLLNMATTLQYDYKFKIILVGDSGVGKSSLMERYTDCSFNPNVPGTVGCDWRSKRINIGGKVICLSIWDTVGQEKYRSLISNYVREAQGCFITYDITRADSIQHIQDWYSYVKNFALPHTVIILIGNKTDLELHRIVTKETGKKLGLKLGIPFFETSAKDTYNVDSAFRCLAATILDNKNLIEAVELKMKNPNIELRRGRREEEHPINNTCSQIKSAFSAAGRRLRHFVTNNGSTHTNNQL